MNVSELIKILGRLPADGRVVLPHFYGGFCDLSSVHPEPVRRVPAMSMADARYEGRDPLSDEPFVPDEIVIVLDVQNTTS
ncbi:hypothetical protein [Paraburkholderia sp. J41]|uniref:hypothetical protein n=1 Tax=Paraburkholderia sp. J41 TaxID=2805433 RepID=UPI002AC352FA|nr:hypothetical protein [Paraburkholderia sp. J41]